MKNKFFLHSRFIHSIIIFIIILFFSLFSRKLTWEPLLTYKSTQINTNSEFLNYSSLQSSIGKKLFACDAGLQTCSNLCNSDIYVQGCSWIKPTICFFILYFCFRLRIFLLGMSDKKTEANKSTKCNISIWILGDRMS